jgi:hypothetical protein
LSQTLQQSQTSALLLRRPELINHAAAIKYLVARMIIRTPLGAADYLRMRTEYEPEEGAKIFAKRLELAEILDDLYRSLFQREYEASQSAMFSSAREHEFYKLVSLGLFPLHIADLTRQPDKFLAGIPVQGQQQHNWMDGCCPFEAHQLVFRLVLVLRGDEPDRWRDLGLTTEPAPPLSRFPWSYFVKECLRQPPPLCHLPLAFYTVGYKTGNVWLDTLPESVAWYEWSAESIAKLLLHRIEAERMKLAVIGLDRWLEEDKSRIEQVVELWDKASTKTREDLVRQQQGREAV